jgi:hypothetical protein
MRADAKAWLGNEVREYFADFGPLGLYELVWMLNGSSFKPPPEEARALSQEVAADLLREGTAELHVLSWPDQKVVPESLPRSTLDDEASWQEGHRFVALVPMPVRRAA